MTIDSLKNYYAQVSRWAFPVLIAVLIFSTFRCQSEADDNRNLADRLNAIEARTVQVENQRGQLIAQNEQLLVKNGREIKRLSDTIFNLNRRDEKLIAQVSSYTRILQSGIFRAKDAVYIEVPVKDPNDSTKIVYIEQPADSNLIRVPRPFAYSDSTIQFAGEVRRNGVEIDSIHVPNTLHLRTLTQKTGFLNLGRKTVVQALNSNPAIVNTGIASVALKVRPTAWNRYIKPLLFAAAGSFVTYKAMK